MKDLAFDPKRNHGKQAEKGNIFFLDKKTPCSCREAGPHNRKRKESTSGDTKITISLWAHLWWGHWLFLMWTFRIRIRRRRRGARWERRGAETCVRFDSPSAVSFHYSFNNFKLFLEFKLCYPFIVYFQFGNYRNYRNQ